MNNKSFLTIILAMLLALLCTVLVFNKKEVKQIPNTSTEIIEKNNEIPLEESTIEVKAEKNVECGDVKGKVRAGGTINGEEMDD